MRFDEGIWDPREDIKVTKAIEVDALITHLDDSAASARNPPNSPPFLKALCATKHIADRGDQLNNALITVKVTSPFPDVIGIEATHFYGRPPYKEPVAPHFPGGKPDDVKPATIDVTNEAATLKTGENSASATIDLTERNFSIGIRNEKDEYVTGFGPDSIAWIVNSNASPALAIMENASTTINDYYSRPPTSSRQPYMSMGLSLEPGEKVYGFGERFGAFVKNGQTIESSNDDRGTSGDGGELYAS
jgi:alpha-D-xyloside xylohydrolase